MTIPRGVSRIRLENFRRFEACTVELGSGSTFVEGENNAGKTSLFYAIEYALFGRVGTVLGPSELIRPGARGVGVELCFVGRDQRAYRLQRVHLRPPRSRTRVTGHFTLWVRDTPDEPERYLLSSDFDDLETDLALVIHEALGTTRRGWDLAVHLRQGHIPDILDGSPQLDLVLGVSAAGFVEEEVRALALEREKQAAALPAHTAALERIDDERTQLTGQRAQLESEQQALPASGTRPGEVEAAHVAALTALEPAQRAADRLAQAEQTARSAADALERARGEAAALGSRAHVAAALASARVDLASIEADRASLAAVASPARAALRKAEQEQGDLAGQRARLQGLGGSERCDTCGQAVDPAALASRIPELEAALAACRARVVEATRAAAEEVAHAEALAERQADLRIEVRDAEAALDRIESSQGAIDRAQHGVDAAQAALATARDEARAHTEADDERLVGTLRDWVRSERDRLQESHGRLRAEAAHADQHRARVQAELGRVRDRLAHLDREHAQLVATCDQLTRAAGQARRLRALSSGLKSLQEGLRERATTGLAARTLELHRHLTGSDQELDSVEVDPKRYVIHVTPRDLGQRVPASHAQGGGHRLLLGLAVRLALAEQVGPVPFVLLDEPTYGLDTAHRQALLTRIASLRVADQLLLITHHDLGDVPQRIRVVRQGATSLAKAPA